AGAGLQHHRVTDVIRGTYCMVRVVNYFGSARNRVYSGRASQFLRLDLVAHADHRLWLRTDKNDADFRQPLGKRGLFRKKSVTRMNRFGFGRSTSIDDLIDR